MKTIQELSENVIEQINDPQKPNSEQPKVDSAMQSAVVTVVNQLLRRLMAIKPAWTKNLRTANDVANWKREWTLAFAENKIYTHSQIDRALTKARLDISPWMPSTGTFIEWCKPDKQSYGLPDERAAYLEACSHGRFASEHDWSHEAVYAAGQATGFFELSNRPETETYPLFKRNYDIVCRRVMNGESLDVTIPKALPTSATTQPTSCESAKAKIADIRAKFGLKKRS